MPALRETQSLCPECLRVIEARYVADAKEDAVYLEKSCPAHGTFRTLAWVSPSAPAAFTAWKNITLPHYEHAAATLLDKGCPFDCGLCPDHAQQTCCALVEVTQRCNMHCPVCYASSEKTSTDPDLAQIAAMLETLWANAGSANVQLSGGEPTVRNDIPEIIRLAHDRGFPFVQLNTNGLRLGEEAGYAQTLKEAGLNLVYLQWDDMRAATLTLLRGGDYLKVKEKALQHCIEAGLSVLLVATLVRGINDDALGMLLDKALSSGPQVRGIHIQPVASFGRYPWKGEAPLRLTIPEVLSLLERQSGGRVKASDFRPPQSEHALCSFSAVYQKTSDNTLECVAGNMGCCCGQADTGVPHAHQARDFVAHHWGTLPTPPASSLESGGFDAFLAQAGVRHRFTISGMLFQDAYSIDLERLRRCHIHVVTMDNRLIPFCAYNMTSISGDALYRKQS